MTPASFTKKDLVLLGRLLIKKNPVIAEELLADLQSPGIPPLESDFSKLSPLFATFCKLRQTTPDALITSSHKTDCLYLKKLFIVVALTIYYPSAIANPDKLSRKKIGIQQQLAAVLRVNKSNLSRMTHESILSYKVYDSFRSEVDIAIKSLYGKSHES